jgi:hypothetical protein
MAAAENSDTGDLAKRDEARVLVQLAFVRAKTTANAILTSRACDSKDQFRQHCGTTHLPASHAGFTVATVCTSPVFASDSDEELEEREDEREEKVQEEDLRQVKDVPQAMPAETQARVVSFQDSVEGINSTFSSTTALAAHAPSRSIRRKSTPAIFLVAPNLIAAKTSAAPPGTPTTPRREPSARVNRRVFGAVVRAQAADGDTENVQTTLPEPPSAQSPQGCRRHGRRSNSLPEGHSNCSGAHASVFGVAAACGQKPLLGQMLGLDLDENIGETLNKANLVRTPREQFQQARPSSSAKAVSALEQDCGIGAYTKSSFVPVFRSSASRSSSSPRARSAKLDGKLQLGDYIGGAMKDVKRPASLVPTSSRRARAAEPQLPAIHVPRWTQQKQPQLRSSLPLNESMNQSSLFMRAAWC